MSFSMFDAFVIPAAGKRFSRASLVTVGGSALVAAVAAPFAPTAAKNKNGKSKAGKKCKRQKAQCASSVARFCAGIGDAGDCEDTLTPCCASLADCQADEAYVCILSRLASLL